MGNGGGRRRFGISIPESIARDLDELASKLKTDRSSLVCEAIRTYIHDHLHYLIPHRCVGLLIIFSGVGGDRYRGFFKVIEKYRDIIISYTHIHADNRCVDILVLSGSSERIRSLHREFIVIGCKARYMPLSYGED